ncbi:hypothetical protein HT031_005483 [Scenedesmus sp. PABB004]|nr:hypothetical protein HT031_005483 [Scenedesmus sp. PABB004]
MLQPGHELDDAFTGLDGGRGRMTVAGFGSLLSERSARSTFPDLQNFRPGRLRGWRRVFAHTADVFWARGIARPATREVASLSCEPCPGSELVVSLFDVPFTPAAVAAFIEREHEFRFVAVAPLELDASPTRALAVLCAANTDEHYRATRCPPEEWARRWGVHGVERVWRDDVLPCRVCGALAARPPGLPPPPPGRARAASPPPTGGRRRAAQACVEVTSKAPIRVLAWKLWTCNRVEFAIAPPPALDGGPAKRTNMLRSLSGSWQLQPVRLPRAALAAACGGAGRRGALPPGLTLEHDGSVLATRVRYEQLALPKGLPPGLRFMPGMRDAVRGSMGREEVHQGLRAQDALAVAAGQLEAAGGSFKRLRGMLAAGAAAGRCDNNTSGAAHPLLDVCELELREHEDAL